VGINRNFVKLADKAVQAMLGDREVFHNLCNAPSVRRRFEVSLRLGKTRHGACERITRSLQIRYSSRTIKLAG
jgi:hypothetical protein